MNTPCLEIILMTQNEKSLEELLMLTRADAVSMCDRFINHYRKLQESATSEKDYWLYDQTVSAFTTAKMYIIDPNLT